MRKTQLPTRFIRTQIAVEIQYTLMICITELREKEKDTIFYELMSDNYNKH